ncbi:hypothetical protein TWF569_009387 [Orbilia oligospora]|nr:hypothetical protein TWF706_007988 [Orbilia oligospora]KAF3136758.1 hypothetical protein TWF569_009387 [Orbilia oligospora]KAF3150050.1 hypothetical protein TWF594_009951 [Orbilia oligospora]
MGWSGAREALEVMGRKILKSLSLFISIATYQPKPARASYSISNGTLCTTMATKTRDKHAAVLEQLHSKLAIISLESAIQDFSGLDLSKVECCHGTKDGGSLTCKCSDACWNLVSAVVCKYKIQDTTGPTNIPFTSHAEHERAIVDSSSNDMSFIGENSTESSCSSSCQSHHSHESDDNYPHEHDDPDCSGHDHSHSHHNKHHNNDGSDQSLEFSSSTEGTHVNDSIDISSSDAGKRYCHEDIVDTRVPESLRGAVLQLPHALVTGHHHHFQIASLKGPCDFHREFIREKLARSELKCACIWIKGILALAFETTPVAHTCCETKGEDHIVARDCCLEDHDLETELQDSLESLPSESGTLVPPKTLRYLSLGVTGMTCTTCETKLARTLRKIDGIIPKGPKGVKTNFMRGKAEIWYNSSVITDPSEQICPVVKRMTGFTCKVLKDTDRLNCNHSEQTVLIKLVLSKNSDPTTIQNHIALLKGVNRVGELTCEELGLVPLCRRLGNRVLKRNQNPEPDPEKGLVGRDWMVFEVKYDPQQLQIRNLLQYMKTSPQGNHSVELFDIDDIDKIAGQQARRELRKMLWLTIVASVLTFPILLITWTPSIKSQVPAASDVNPSHLKSFIILQIICFVLAAIVQTLAKGIYLNAFRSIFFQHRLDMDCLITLSTTAAFVYSVAFWGMNLSRELLKLDFGQPPDDAESERHEPIFEASSLLITLILAGRLLTGYIRHWAANRISVGTLQVNVCTRSTQYTFRPIRNRRWKTEDVRLLHYGDVLLAQTGDIVVTDGVVINGDATVDESHLTGESEPAQHQRGSTVIAGSKVIEGRLEYRVTRLIPENTISSMKRLVTAASSSRPKMQNYADKVAAWLTPVVLLIALAAFAGWIGYYRTAKKHTEDLSAAFAKALTIAITILAISCPCAIALAVPTVLIFATQVGVKCGIVIKSPESLEKARKVRYFVADKTGTLTTGRLQVAAEKYWVRGQWVGDTGDKDVREVQHLIYKLIARDRHPVSKAVLDKLKEYHTKELQLSDAEKNIRSIVGKGIEGTVKGRRVRGGKPSWVLTDNIKNFSKAVFRTVVEDDARTPFVVVDVRNSNILAVFGLSDTIRPEAASVISKLQAQNIECFMLSGDQLAVCKQVAEAIGIPLENIYGECSPEDKAQRIRLLQTRAQMDVDILQLRGHFIRRVLNRFRTRQRYVLFLGDGTNDAAALTRADIGVTMSNCTDIAAGCADAGILSSSLTGVLALLALSKRATRLIKCNFSWALKYNLGAVLISTGIIPWTLAPQYAGVGEAVSVAPVFIIASTILWWKLKY